MRLNHIHVSVRDLDGALEWLEQVWQVKSDFRNERMTTLIFDAFTLILDSAASDSAATIGFQSNDCDRDFRAVVERGAVAIEAPTDKPWGVRCAYLQGPGALKFEIEQPLSR